MVAGRKRDGYRARALERETHTHTHKHVLRQKKNR
jgi:hypothetical protein